MDMEFTGLRQGMVVGRHATVTYIEVVVQCHIFLFDTVRIPVFHLSKNRTENRFHIPVHAVNRVQVHKTIVITETQHISKAFATDVNLSAVFITLN